MKKTILIILIFIFSVTYSQQVLAAACTNGAGGLVPCAKYCDDPATAYNEEDPCTLCHFFVMFDRIVDFIMLTLVPIVAVLMLVIGGVMFFLATGNPSALSQAKSVITTTILGLIIVYAAWIIVNMFFVVIGVNIWTGLATGWFTINCPL